MFPNTVPNNLKPVPCQKNHLVYIKKAPILSMALLNQPRKTPLKKPTPRQNSNQRNNNKKDLRGKKEESSSLSSDAVSHK